MSDKCIVNRQTLVDLADSIRSKSNVSSDSVKYTPGEMSSAILSIQSGDHDNEQSFIPDDLPKDFKNTVMSNRGSFRYALGLLYRTSVCLGNTYTFLGKDIITSDGQHFTDGTNQTPINITINESDPNGWWWIIIRDDEQIVWNRSEKYNLKHFGLTWVYGTPGTRIHASYNQPLVNAPTGELSHLRIIDLDTHISYIGGLTYLKAPNQTWVRVKCHGDTTQHLASCMINFCSDCRSLRYADITCETPSAVTSFKSMFRGCYSLVEICNFPDLSNAIDTSEMLAYCQSLREVPDSIDLSKSENTAKMF